MQYLNLRGNRFKEIPKAVRRSFCRLTSTIPLKPHQVYKLPQLEILDLSRNKLSKVPDEIGNMKALRVLSLLNNSIENVPYCLGNLDTLRILKLAGNPLSSDLMRIVNGSDGTHSPSLATLTDNEKDTLLTKRIKKHLKVEAAARESGDGSSSDGPLDTPRPLKRNLSLRFPVKVSTSGSESASDIRSPGFPKQPMPPRSHYRVASGQNDVLQHAALRRPGLTPLSAGNERNRSNSESILQATQNNRSKRMGIVTRKNSELGTVDETNRNSHHFRGQSHSSVLRDKHSNGVRNGGNGSSSPRDVDRQRGMFVRRLSSLPEYKRESRSPDSIIEGAKGVLYSLHQVHPHISTLITVVKDGNSKRSSLERVYHNAITHLDHLDLELHNVDSKSHISHEEKVRSTSNISFAASACIAAYRHVGNILLRNIPQLVADGDQRYIRTLILLVYGSLIEARNACWTIGITPQSLKPQKGNHLRISTIEEEHPKRRDRSITPTRDRPNPEKRFRNGNIVQHPSNHSQFSSVSSTNSTVPLYVNGRSRSNSRTNTLPISATSSVANTPRSGDSFMGPGTPMIRSRSNSAVAVGQAIQNLQPPQDGSDHEAQFEKIFLTLSKAVDLGTQTIPGVLEQFRRSLEVAQRTSYTAHNIHTLWTTLISRSRVCIDMCDILKMRLSTIKLNEPDVRNAKDFWRICVSFTNSVVKLMDGIADAKRLDIVPNEVIQMMRPVLKLARLAFLDINKSPWSNFASVDELPATTNGNGYHRARGSSGGSNSSPFSVPATPLSAALGPAAQATVPSAPPSASLERSFQGDIFQRADTLASYQNTMVYRRA